mmetsp:Transcript_102033/g.286784  ORF Transcript_102033/g.286784 Transcript_102033/m.286784 type:complete len:249 (+) Transcript_102033:335-1081(+)
MMPPLSEPPTTFQTCAEDEPPTGGAAAPATAAPDTSAGAASSAAGAAPWAQARGGLRSHSLTYGMAVVSAAMKEWPHPKSNLDSQKPPMRLAKFFTSSGGVMLSLELPQTRTSILASCGICSQVLWAFLASSCRATPSLQRGTSRPTFSSRVSKATLICHSVLHFSFHSSVRSMFAWNIFRETLSSIVTPGAYQSWIGKDEPPSPPVAQQHSTSLFTSCGCRSARCCATMPPKELPRTYTGNFSGTIA